MRVFDEATRNNVERRELHLAILTCSVITVLGTGIAALLYPAPFANSGASRFPITFFAGFCVLCILFAGYVWDRQQMIRRLRRQLISTQQLITQTQAQAGLELLSALPDFELFKDSLPTEVRRAVASSSELSVLMITFKMSADLSSDEGKRMLSGAAKVLSAKIRQGDSIYILSPTGCMGIVMPNASMGAAIRASDWMADGLSQIAGMGTQFSFWMNVVNYPTHASSASRLLQAIEELIPKEKPAELMGVALAAKE